MNLRVPVQLYMAWRNVFRQATRSAATLAAISIGVAGLILAGGFVQDIFFQLGEATIHSQTGHIQINRPGYQEGKMRQPEAYLIDNADELKKRLSAEPSVDMVLARTNFTGTLNNGKRDLGVIGEGVEADKETKVGTYLRYMEGRPLTDQDKDGMVVGQGVAQSLGLKVGDRITLVMTLAQGAVNTLDFELVGVFQSFSKDFDARAIRIPLAAAHELMDTQGVHLLVVNLHETRQTDQALASVRRILANDKLEVVGWRSLSDFYEKTVDLYDRQFGVLRLIILLMVLLSVANSVNMTLFERTREFGTMLAVGNRPVVVFRLLLIESVILGMIGAICGMALGTVLGLAISAIGIPMPPPPNANISYTAVIRLVPADILIAGGIGFVATCLATIMPARRAANHDVVEALRAGV